MEIQDYDSTNFRELQYKIVNFVDTVYSRISKTSKVSVDNSDKYWQAIRYFNIAPASSKKWYEDYLEKRGAFQMKVPDKSYHIQNGGFVEINPLESDETVFEFIFMF